MKYLVKSKDGYYQGWCQGYPMYGGPMYSHDIRDARRMSRSGASRAVKRLHDVKVWGDKTAVMLKDE